MNVIRNNYAENEHLALASDLETIRELGLKVIPLSQVVDWHQGSLTDEDVSACVAITFDDGSWFDFYDLHHPTCGMQRSMFNILRDFNKRNGPSSTVVINISSKGCASECIGKALIKSVLVIFAILG
jgi:hypothetical protein